MALPEEVWGRGPGAPWEYVPNLLSAPALVTSSSLWPLSGSLSTCQSCPLCLSLPISPSVSSTISRLSPSLTSLLFLCICLTPLLFLSLLSLFLAFLLFSVLVVFSLSASLSLCPSRSPPSRPLWGLICVVGSCQAQREGQGAPQRPAQTAINLSLLPPVGKTAGLREGEELQSLEMRHLSRG